MLARVLQCAPGMSDPAEMLHYTSPPLHRGFESCSSSAGLGTALRFSSLWAVTLLSVSSGHAGGPESPRAIAHRQFLHHVSLSVSSVLSFLNVLFSYPFSIASSPFTFHHFSLFLLLCAPQIGLHEQSME